MVTALLDVNVLIALLWPSHKAHEKAQHWFVHNARFGWATCAITEAGFVRIVSNPTFSNHPVSPQDALLVLGESLQHRQHTFWNDDLPALEALAKFGPRLLGHQQVTDAYLLALAVHKKGRFVTMDQGISSLASVHADARNSTVVL